ncbi:MAG: hypothetical protein OEZ43_09655 [Gammaproteobacteria bacterium]|nr:hypothetical protein [Gammaproteobacteria bacterium]
MKSILTVWIIAFTLYSLTPLVIASEKPPRAVIPVWGAYAVVGDVCVEIRNQSTGEPAMAELWLVNDERVQWFDGAQGEMCLPVEFSSKSELYAVINDDSVGVKVVRDTTTGYFTIELPL